MMRIGLHVVHLLAAAVCWSALDSAAQDRRGPFTHPPRSVRSRDVDQIHFEVNLKFDFDKQEIGGRVVHQMTAFKPLRSITLDAADMKIGSVVRRPNDDDAADVPLVFQHKGDRLSVALDREVAVGETILLVIQYTIVKPDAGAHFVVPDANEPTQPKMVWTQSEPEYARYWIPCVDTPSDRMTSEIRATVPAEYYVLSNGTLKSKSMNDDGTQTWHWVQQKTHVPYLMSVVAGEFDVYEQSWADIPLQSFVPKGRLADAARSFEKTARMMEFFTNRIGHKYPWPKYAQICVDEYNWGGMEHTSATTLNLNTLHDERAHLDVSSDNLVAHELAHQWFGDLMTCKDWSELWLNESFATYFATLWAEEDKGWDEAAWQRFEEAESYLGEDKRYRRPIVSNQYNDPANMFDRHSYPKGGRVLHMLRFELGDDLFWKAINRYTEVNQFRTVETADLRIAIEDATGLGMNWFFDQWIHHGGHPEFEAAWDWDAAASSVRLTVKQTQKTDSTTPLFRTSAEIELATPSDTVIRRVTLSKAEETFHFELDQQPTRVCFDPRDWILKTLKFDKSKEELLDQLTNDAYVICRIRAARELAKLNKHDDVRDRLISAARGDAFWPMRQEAVKALAKFNHESVRAALIEAAQNDDKSFVRREAVKSLAGFAHDETRQALRGIIVGDPSYYAVAESLRTLVKIDRDQCAADLLAALDVESHRDEILKAACDGLLKLKEAKAEPRMRAMLEQQIPPHKRVILISSLARLKSDDPSVAKLLHQQLDDDRSDVRRAAIDALIEIGGTASLDALQDRRPKELDIRMLARLDEALEEIRNNQTESQQLRSEIETLRKQNRTLEGRLKKLEADKQ